MVNQMQSQLKKEGVDVNDVTGVMEEMSRRNRYQPVSHSELTCHSLCIHLSLTMYSPVSHCVLTCHSLCAHLSLACIHLSLTRELFKLPPYVLYVSRVSFDPATIFCISACFILMTYTSVQCPADCCRRSAHWRGSGCLSMKTMRYYRFLYILSLDGPSPVALSIKNMFSILYIHIYP